jgi:hypothetical protein
MESNLGKSENKSMGRKLPTAQFKGTLQIGDAELPCYMLDDGRRVFSTRGILASLGYKANARPSGIFGSKALEPIMETYDHPFGDSNLVEFDAGSRFNAKGYDVEKFMDICHAMSKALDAGMLIGQHIDAAHKANIIIRACSKIGIIALVDEATGYQYVREDDALQFKLKLYLAEEMRQWEKTFPDDLWIEFARLTQWDGQPTKNRPRYWGYLVMELIYRYLDPEIAQYIKDNKPKPRKGQNYHQWFNADIGMKKLIEHINRVIGMAQGCDSMDELKKKMSRRYGKQPIQLELFMEKNDDLKEPKTQILMPFDEAMKRIVSTSVLARSNNKILVHDSPVVANLDI